MQTGRKATGDVVSRFSRNKAVGIGLPIQQQRFAVDVQHLTVAFIGCYCQNNGITNPIHGLVSGYRAAFKSRNGNRCRFRSFHKRKWNLYILYACIAIHTQPDLCHFAVISCVEGNGFHQFTIHPQFRIGPYKLNMEFHAVAFQQLLLLCSCQISLPLPTGKGIRAAHILKLVIAVCIGIVHSDLVLFPIIEDKGNLHREVALFQAAVCIFAGRVILHSYRHFFIIFTIGHYRCSIFLLCNG